MSEPKDTFPPRPRWMEEDQFVAQLLGRFLTKLDKGQRPYLRISEKTAPQLYDFQSEDVTFLWHLVVTLETEYRILQIKRVRTGPHQEAWEGAKLYLTEGKEALVRHWLGRPAVAPYDQAWKTEVSKMASRFEDDGEALLANVTRIPGQGAKGVVRAFSTIGEALQQPLTLRALSARCFWGDSKFLDRREDLVRALFPSLTPNLKTRPLLLMVHLPESVNDILFIENQDSFIALSEQAPTGMALVYSAGFRGSAQRIREPGKAVFSYLNPTGRQKAQHAFERWWCGEGDRRDLRAWFWGDLDFSGMAILKALRVIFDGIEAWPPGYLPLLERLRQGQAHAHDASAKAAQQDPGYIGCDLADQHLLPAMRECKGFVDQEAVNAGEALCVTAPAIGI